MNPFFRSYATILLLPVIALIFCGCRKTKEEDGPGRFPVKWEYSFNAPVYYASPALSNDEKTVYTGTSGWASAERGINNVFAAIDVSTGKIRWTVPLDKNEVRSSPAVAPDNSVYFAVELRDNASLLYMGDELWHVSAEGTVLWKFDINPGKLSLEVGLSAPAVGTDGTVYVGGDYLYAINPNGTLRWKALTNNDEALRNAPVVGEDGTVYFVSHNIPLTALNPSDGSVKWSIELGVNDHCLASPAIGRDGTLYVATQPGILYAVSSSGQVTWTFNLVSVGFTGTFRSSPAVDHEGCVYFGINTGSPCSAFFALRPDGTLKWKFEPSDLPSDIPSTHFDIYSSPALGADSIVYFGQEFGRVYGLAMADGSFKGMRETHAGITWSSPAIDSKGILYINDIYGTLFALETGSTGLDPNAPWPRYRGNNQGTGRK